MDKEDEEVANNSSPLPLDLVIEILTRVPPKPLFQFKCVSKEWLGLISNPSFIKRHVSKSIQANSSGSGTLIIHHGTTLYTLDFSNPNFCATKLYYPENINLPQPGKIRLLGSCNGLLCIEFGNQIALYNPTTQAHKIIPEYNFVQADEKPKIVFAYDCISDDYKVLRFTEEILGHLVPLFPGNILRRILLYSLSTNSWETIENPDWNQDSVQFPGVVANNSIYWMDNNHQNIKSFDLFSRRFCEMHLPEKISPGYSPKLGVLAGRLYIVTYYFDIWKLEDSSAQESCWTRVFRCPSSQWYIIFKLLSGLHNWLSSSFSLACSEDGCKILVARVRGPPNFICCDLESGEANMIEILGLTGNRFSSILPWAGSLVLLAD